MLSAEHYHCCDTATGGGDATMDKQNQILAAIAALAGSGGSGDASESTVQATLAEVEKLTKGLRTNN